MWRCLSIVCLFLLPGIGFCQLPDVVPSGKVASSITPTTGTVGQQFILSLRATTQSEKPLYVEPLDDAETTWTVIGRPSVRRERKAGLTVHDVKLKIAPFLTGQLLTPPMALEWIDASGSTVTLISDPIPVTIASVLPDTTGTLQLKATKAPVALPVPKGLKYAAWALAVFSLAAVLYVAWRRWGHRVKALMKPPTPDAEALSLLEKLEDEKLIEQKRIREYYTRLADAVREYAGKVYMVPAMDLTTSELLTASEAQGDTIPLEQRAPLHEALKPLQTVLEEADLVKFARFYPEEKQARQALEQARQIISKTRFRFAPPPAGKSASTISSADSISAGRAS